VRRPGDTPGWHRARPGSSWLPPARLALVALVALVVLSGATWASQAASGSPPAKDSGAVGHIGAITVTASSLRPGYPGTLTGSLHLTTSGAASDQLDAALAAGDAAVGVYHQQVSVGEIPDLASCDGDLPPPLTLAQWLHYGPLLVPGRAYGPSPPASATLSVSTPGVTPSGSLAITFYFAHAGALILDVPVRRT
jgi:hypothetical protein